MMGSPMVLIFILPLIVLEYLFTGFGDLIGIDINSLIESFDFESFKNVMLPIELIIEMFYQMFN